MKKKLEDVTRKSFVIVLVGIAVVIKLLTDDIGGACSMIGTACLCFWAFGD